MSEKNKELKLYRKNKTHKIEGNRVKEHILHMHLFFMLSSFICAMLLFIGVASATIIGTLPNSSDVTNIYNDTTWSIEDLTLSGNVIIHPGGSLTLDRTTLIFASTLSINYGINVKRGNATANGGRLKVINGSSVTVQNPDYNTWIYAEFEYPASSKSPVIQASDSYFSELGKGYYGGADPKRYGLELQYTTSESYFDNITLTNSYNGIYLPGGEQVNITNCTLDNIEGAAIFAKYVGAYIFNNTITNMRFGVYAQYTDGLQIISNTFDAGTYQSGSYVIDILGNPDLWEKMDRNFSIKDNEFTNFQRAVVCVNGIRDGIIEGNTATNGTGAAFGAGGGVVRATISSNVTIRNNTAINTQDGVCAGGQEFNIYDNEIINPVLPNLISAGMRFTDLYNSSASNITIRNVDQTATTGASMTDSSNVSISNISIQDFKYGLQLSNVSDTQFTDLDISGIGTYDIDFHGLNGDIKFINAKFDSAKINFLYNDDVFLPYYYLGVEVVDLNNNPIAGAVVTITNDVDSDYPSINANGENVTSVVTGADDFTPLLSDPENPIAILDFRQTKMGKEEMSYTLSAELGNSSNTTTIIPDSSWHRSNPNTYQNTVTIVLETGSDTPQPTITNISAIDVTSSSATITWTTDEPATSQMEYGLTTSYDTSTTLDTILVTLHSQTITELTPSTTYHYRVKSNDTSNNLAISVDYTFLTTEEAEGLVGYWNFDESSEDTAYDSSGNDNHGSLVNGPQLVDGKIGGALSFDGTDDYVNCGNAASLNTDSVTVEAFLKFNPFPTGKHFLGKVGKWVFYCGDNKFNMLIWNGPQVSSTTVSSLDTWYHVVGTYDGSIAKIYVDGVEENNVSGSSSSQSTCYNLTIGYVESGDYFNGTIDEVRVYSRVLSADEILAHYQAGLGDDTNTLSGAVTGPDSTTGIAGATVTLATPDGTEIETVQADSTGHYEFTDVSAGDYDITATKRSYWPDSNPVTLNASEPTTADIVLCQKGDFNTNSEPADAGDLAMMADATVNATLRDETYDLDGDGNPADAADLTLLKDVSVGVAELE